MTGAEPQQRGSSRGALLLAAILALAVALRLVGLGSSFWIDEVDTVRSVATTPLATIATTYASENHHPLYSVAMRLAIVAFGPTERAARLPALLFGVLSLWAVARLGRAVAGEATGLCAALLLAVSAHHVWFSQNARGYTGMLLLVVLATSELLALQERPTRGGALRYALFAALAAYTHLTAVFAFVGHALAWLALRPRPVGGTRRANGTTLAAMGLAALFAALLYAPLASDLGAAFTARATGATVQVAKVEPWTSPAWAVRQVVESLGLAPAALAGLAIAALLALLGVVHLWREGKRLFVALHLVAPPIALATLLLLGRHLYPRFFFFEAGFGAIALVRGARAAGAWLARRWPSCGERCAPTWGVALVVLLAAGSSLSLGRVYAHPKQDFTGARDLVEARAQLGDAKVAVGPAKLALPGWYAPSWSIADTADELAALRAGATTTWLVSTLPEQLAAARPDLFAAIERDFTRVAELPGSMGGGAVFVWRAPR